MTKEKLIAFKAIIYKTQTLTNGNKRITLDVDIADKETVAPLDCMTEADGVMIAVAIERID